MRSEEIVGTLERKHLLELLSKGQRKDGRGFSSIREVKIIPNVIKKAEGSAMVKLGETIVVAGVKGQLGAPFLDTPNQGVLIVNIEMSPIASPVFESGPPGVDAIETSRVVDRGIRESNVVDLSHPDMCVVPGEKVWILFVDIYIINDNGNLIDASSLAAMAALMTTKLPKMTIDEETGETQEVEGETILLPRKGVVASLTYAKIDKHIICDPGLTEDRAKQARFTVSIRSDGIVCSMQKGESGTFTKDELLKILDDAAIEVKKLHTVLEQIDPNIELQPMFEFN